MSECARERRRFADTSDVALVEADWREATGSQLLSDSPFHQLIRASERHPDRLAIRFVPDATHTGIARDVSFAALRRDLYAAANALYMLGARPDRPVAFLMANTPEAIALIWGGTAASIVAPISHYLEPELIGAMLACIQAEILVTDAGSDAALSWDKVDAAVSRSGCVRKILRLGPGPDHPHATQWEETRLRLADDRLESARKINGSDISSYFHTGGTTGLPKFARQSHGAQALATNVAGFAMGIDSSERVLAGMPIFHVGGLMGCGLVPLAHGASIVQATRVGYRNPEVTLNLWSLAAKHSVTMLVGPPTLFARLCDVPIDRAEPSTVRHAISSAAGLPPEVHRRFENHAGIRLREIYGITEATLLVAATPPDGVTKIGAVGIRVPFMEIDVFDAQALSGERRVVPSGTQGIVAVRGPMIFSGYLSAVDAAEAHMGEGWLNTGDLGRIDHDGYLYLTGRSKDLIIRGGHNIDPRMIEDSLAMHPAVATCAAVGKPDAYVGEVPLAYVVLRAEASATAEDLLRFAREHIPERAAVPKAILLVEALPATPVGKISKLDLRRDAIQRAAYEALADLIDQGAVLSVQAVADMSGGTRVIIKAPIVQAEIEQQLRVRLGQLNLNWELNVLAE